LPGRDGGFHMCAAWLIEAIAMVGRVDDAHFLTNSSSCSVRRGWPPRSIALERRSRWTTTPSPIRTSA
jgi:hypothetical protein